MEKALVGRGARQVIIIQLFWNLIDLEASIYYLAIIKGWGVANINREIKL